MNYFALFFHLTKIRLRSFVHAVVAFENNQYLSTTNFGTQMKTTKKTALILGSTGLTGSLLLQALLEDDRYIKVRLFNRQHCGLTHPKIDEHILDLFDLEKHEPLFVADDVFCCIGSTQKKTPDLSVYKKVDYGIPLAAAKLCAKNKIETLVVISALGANAKSLLFYNRTKGEMEKAVAEQQIANTYFLRPALIGGERKEKRPGELTSKKLLQGLGFLLIGFLRKYRLIYPENIVKAMVDVANNGYENSIILSDKIIEIAKKHD